MSEITVTLTEKQIDKLKCYLNMQKQTRIREQNSWKESAKEKNPDGTPKYKHAEGNAKWWAETNAVLDEVVEVLNDACINKKTAPTLQCQKAETK